MKPKLFLFETSTNIFSCKKLAWTFLKHFPTFLMCTRTVKWLYQIRIHNDDILFTLVMIVAYAWFAMKNQREF